MSTRRWPSVPEIRATYGSKRDIERGESWLGFFVFRPVSFWITPPFTWGGLSPNQVTLLGIGIGFLGMLFIILGGSVNTFIGIGLYFAGIILDYVDGNIARYYGLSNHFGKFLDGLSDTAVGVYFYLAIALSLFVHSKTTLFDSVFGPALGGGFLLLSAALAEIAFSMRLLLIWRFRAATLDVQMQRIAQTERQANSSRTGTDTTLTPGNLAWWRRLGRRVLRLLEMQDHVTIDMTHAILIVVAVLDMLELYVVWVLMVEGVFLALTLGTIMRQARVKLDVSRPV